MLVVECAAVRTHVVAEDTDGTLAGGNQLREVPLVVRGPWGFAVRRIGQHALAEIGPVLLEVLGDVFDEVVIAELAVGFELAKVDQLGEGGVRLVLADLVDLALHLHPITVVIV